ncbi:MAG: hypothetical protein U0744_09415 [Gemmataceae bacterium]
MLRCRWVLAFLFPLLLAIPAAAQDTTPAAVVRFRSIDAAIEGARMLAKLALEGDEKAADDLFRQVEGELKSKVGIKAVEGIDRTRPLGAYLRLGKEIDDVSGALLIPVDDEKKFLALIEGFPVTVNAFGGGVYTISNPSPIEFYLKFANKYAYITAMNKNSLDNMVDPAKVLGTAKDGPLFHASGRFDQVPETARQLVLAAVEDKLQEEANKNQPNETPASKELRVAILRQMTQGMKSLLNEGQEASLKVDIDPTNKKVKIESSLTGKTGTDLAKTIQGAAEKKSGFASLGNNDPAVRGSLNMMVPDSVRKAFNKVIDEAATKSLESISDAPKKKQAQELFDALSPTLRSGEVDLFGSLMGPGADKKYVVLAGTKVEKGKHLQETLLKLLDELLAQAPDQVKALIKLNIDESNGTKIHRFDIPAMGGDQEKLERIVGALQLSIAIREDAAFIALGSGGQDALKEALKAKGTVVTPLSTFEVNIGKLFAGIEGDLTEAARERILRIAKEAGNPPVRITLEGGSSLRGAMDVPFAVIQALSPKAVKK